MPRNKSDVLIIGGGPAGSMTAYHLAKAGVNVSIIDRSHFPRQKACGGGIQHKCLADIPFDISPVIQNIMFGISFSYKLNKAYDQFTKYFVEKMSNDPKPLVYGVLRSDFDNVLLESAEKAGARVYQQIHAKSIERRNKSLVVIDRNDGVFECQILVGADGANSIVSRELNDRGVFLTQVGLYAEVPRDLIRPDNVNDAVMRVDWGTLPSGYAWIFPKRDTVNIGVGGPELLTRQLRNYFKDFLLAEKLIDLNDLEKIPLIGHKLPTMTLRTKVSGEGILLVGDAAGFIDPLTGDGISYALHSAHLAAKTILRTLDSDGRNVSQYSELVSKTIYPEIFHARGLMTCLNTFPHMIHRMFMKNDWPWRGFCRVLRGDNDPDTGVLFNYQHFRSKRLGLLKFIWYFIDPFTKWYMQRRIIRVNARETLFQKFVASILGPLSRPNTLAIRRIPGRHCAM